MNQEMAARRRKLIDALRSGRYRKARGQLRKGNRFCATGVACDLFAQDHPLWMWDGNYFGQIGIMQGFAKIPPYAVVDYFGLDRVGLDHLMDANDKRGGWEPVITILEEDMPDVDPALVAE
jgi:hypothetical protein